MKLERGWTKDESEDEERKGKEGSQQGAWVSLIVDKGARGRTSRTGGDTDKTGEMAFHPRQQIEIHRAKEAWRLFQLLPTTSVKWDSSL